MTQLPWPVRKVVRAGLDDVAVERIWQHLKRRRATSRAAWALPWPRVVVICALAVMVMTSAAVWILPQAPTALAPMVGPIRLLGGVVPSTMTASANESRLFSFTEGSSVTLRPSSRLEVLENNNDAFVAMLSTGAAGFRVQPGGPRRRTIECGLATVEVVGTRFTISCEASMVRVDVEHGVVLVRGDRVPDRVQRLTDGQSIEVTSLSETTPRNDFGTPDAAARSPVSTRCTDPRPPASVPWQDIARRGDYAEAYDLLGPGGIRRIDDVGSVQDLLTLADVARLSGHPADAVAPLRRIISERPEDPSAPLAAFALGRVELDALGDPSAAADAFERAIALGIPRGLLEDACARLVEARARARDLVGARRAADEYLTRFPQGSRASDVARWANIR